MARGTIKWFSGEKGFGFVEDEEGDSLLVHYTEIAGEGFRSLERGAKIEFEVTEDGRGRRLAANVRPLAEAEVEEKEVADGR